MPYRQRVDRRADDRILEELRTAIAAGCPWDHNARPPAKGFADLIYLVRGLFYSIADYIEFTRSEVGKAIPSRESAVALWEGLREDILAEHIKHSPGTRPFSWWNFEDREPRRVVGIDDLMVPHNGGKILEDETDYLKRFKLLNELEKRHLRAQERANQ
jgi:hypothetical protein